MGVESEASKAMIDPQKRRNRPTVHDALKVALLLLRLRGCGILVLSSSSAAVGDGELALVPPLDDVVDIDGGHEAVDGGVRGAAAVGAPDDAETPLLGRAEHAADAAAATLAIVDDAGCKVSRLPGRRR